MNTIKIQFKIESTDNSIDKNCSIELKIPEDLDFKSHAGQNPADMVENFFWFTCLSIAKGLTYGDSWKKHGLKFSIFPNCLRKVDRVEVGVDENLSDSICDGAADACVYFELLLQWVMENYKDAYNEWLTNDVKKYIDKYLGTELVSKIK